MAQEQMIPCFFLVRKDSARRPLPLPFPYWSSDLFLSSNFSPAISATVHKRHGSTATRLLSLGTCRTTIGLPVRQRSGASEAGGMPRITPKALAWIDRLGYTRNRQRSKKRRRIIFPSAPTVCGPGFDGHGRVSSPIPECWFEVVALPPTSGLTLGSIRRHHPQSGVAHALWAEAHCLIDDLWSRGLSRARGVPTVMCILVLDDEAQKSRSGGRHRGGVWAGSPTAIDWIWILVLDLSVTEIPIGLFMYRAKSAIQNLVSHIIRFHKPACQPD
ncbi:hypothetical protein LZ30DRAFT_767782 [Colletotrichum cereale]|nr:hypothetical protein LZ30DRAFT_767782 [Colletotrichum cereale]